MKHEHQSSSSMSYPSLIFQHHTKKFFVYLLVKFISFTLPCSVLVSAFVANILMNKAYLHLDGEIINKAYLHIDREN